MVRGEERKTPECGRICIGEWQEPRVRRGGEWPKERIEAGEVREGDVVADNDDCK